MMPRKPLLLIPLIVMSSWGWGMAQERPRERQAPSDATALDKRLDELAAQLKGLQEQLAAMRESLNRQAEPPRPEQPLGRRAGAQAEPVRPEPPLARPPRPEGRPGANAQAMVSSIAQDRRSGFSISRSGGGQSIQIRGDGEGRITVTRTAGERTMTTTYANPDELRKADPDAFEMMQRLVSAPGAGAMPGPGPGAMPRLGPGRMGGPAPGAMTGPGPGRMGGSGPGAMTGPGPGRMGGPGPGAMAGPGPGPGGMPGPGPGAMARPRAVPPAAEPRPGPSEEMRRAMDQMRQRSEEAVRGLEERMRQEREGFARRPQEPGGPGQPRPFAPGGANPRELLERLKIRIERLLASPGLGPEQLRDRLRMLLKDQLDALDRPPLPRPEVREQRGRETGPVRREVRPELGREGREPPRPEGRGRPSRPERHEDED